jgi:pSer/pThr/pTyr-binding forkhead associated (FHA) protein
MAFVTLSILEGLERGRVFRNLQPPITIGREEINDVQLNDERISRLHAKLQDDHGNIIFTDLNSTNGSRVNGHPVQLHVMRPGDHLQLGRCTLLYGSAEEISERARSLGVHVTDLLPVSRTFTRPDVPAPTSEFSQPAIPAATDHLPASLFCGECPPLPELLTPIQRARLADLLMYASETLMQIVLTSAQTDCTPPTIAIDWARFQNLLKLQKDLAHWIRETSNPHLDEHDP